MTAARRRALSLLALALLIGLVAAFAWTRAKSGEEARLGPRADRPDLLLLTSLPLAFGDSFALDAAGSPVLDAIEQRYRVRIIATASPSELKGARLLLMAHPLAQPAEDLVALDDWVRKGGRLLLLADPRLEWADRRPLGDPTRPPPMFMDTGLLGHWGLRLDPPEESGDRYSTLAGRTIMARSPGQFHGTCKLSEDRIVAKCRIGAGTAILVADADFLDWSRAEAGAQGSTALLVALDSLERG